MSELHLVDSSGWLEYFSDGPNAERFTEPLSNPDRLVVPTVSLYEVFRVVLRERGEDDADPRGCTDGPGPGGPAVVVACAGGRAART